MEASQNWNVEIVPGARRVKRAAAVVGRLVSFLPTEPLSRGDHVSIADRGAAVMLDQYLDQEPQLPFPGEVGAVEIIDFRAAASDY